MIYKIKHVHIPENKAYYKAQEDCCFEIVSYDETNLGVTTHADDSDKELNSWDLLCNCYPKVEMIDISEEEYESKLKEICKKMEGLGLKDKCLK